jgi:hypothetical protein
MVRCDLRFECSFSYVSKLKYLEKALFFWRTVLKEREKQSFKESLLEIFYILKACVSSFWFWLPALFAVYLYLELYLLCVSPLLVLIGPVITIVYVLIWEEKRVKAQYGINDVKVLSSLDPLFSKPRRATSVEVEKLVDEYKKLIEKRSKKSKNVVENDGQ